MMHKKIIILIGPICAGKGQASEILQHDYHYNYLRFSASLEAIMYEKYGKITRELYAIVANELREKYGPQALAKVTVEQAQKEHHHKIIIDGARNPAEVQYIREQFSEAQVLALGITAPQELRFARLLSRQRLGDPQTFEAFKLIDEKELNGDFGPNGIRINDCLSLADTTIENTSTFEELSTKLDTILKQSNM